MTMTPLQVAESFHLAFLQALAVRANTSAWALKGGGNLRFFYPSDRFSEDIDIDTFDIEPWVFQERVDQALASDLLARTLRVLGTQADHVNPKERSPTKSKWVIGLMQTMGGEPAYTKVEVSHREYPYRAFVKVEPVTEAAVAPYAAALRRPTFGHYLPRAAVAQKIDALGGRTVRQPRDVFDLDLLFRVAPDAVKRGDIAEAGLRTAIARILDIGFDEYRSKVLSFLEPAVAPLYEATDAWESMQIGVAERLEALLP
jgi:predicted nucleotidyltransferase component of viral defense system